MADSLEKKCSLAKWLLGKKKNCFLTPDPSPPFSLNHLLFLSLISQMALTIIPLSTKLSLCFIHSVLKYYLSALPNTSPSVRLS